MFAVISLIPCEFLPLAFRELALVDILLSLKRVIRTAQPTETPAFLYALQLGLYHSFSDLVIRSLQDSQRILRCHCDRMKCDASNFFIWYIYLRDLI